MGKSVADATDRGMFLKSEFDRLDVKLQKVLNVMLETYSLVNKSLLKKTVYYALKIWKYPYTQKSNLSYEAMFVCCLEIANCKYNESDSMHRLEWCHKIFNFLSQSEIENGWRVSFFENSYYYVNDKIYRRKIVNFHFEGVTKVAKT